MLKVTKVLLAWFKSMSKTKQPNVRMKHTDFQMKQTTVETKQMLLPWYENHRRKRHPF